MELKTNKSLLIIIFITAFIDMLGIGIIIPVIPEVFFGKTSHFFNGSVTHESKSIMFGYLLASYPFMQFIGAPLLGSLSDRYGRKPILRIALIGSLIGYIIFGYGITRGSLALLFISRLLPGFMGGNISILMSSVADISKEEAKPRNFALIGMAFGLGFIFGPSLGGILADSDTVSWFTLATPFWFTALLTAFNIILLQFIFKETIKERTKSKLSLFTGIKNINKSFTDAKLRNIFLIVLLLSLGFSFFTQFFSVYLIDKFDFSPKEIGFLYGWIGVWLVITQGGIVRILSKKYSPEKILVYSILLLTIGLIFLLLPHTPSWFYIINPIIAIGQGLTGPNLTTIVSNKAGIKHQGEILGLNQSMMSIGRTIPPVAAGYLNAMNVNLPLVVAALLSFLAWAGYMLVVRDS